MGRGLAELQKRILVYVRDNRLKLINVASWFDGLNRHGAMEMERAILPPSRKPQHMPGAERFLPKESRRRTASDIAAISRALRRLETRGLVECLLGLELGVRNSKRRARYVGLTPEGEEVARSL
jgi:hypothetical protein